jgi:ribonuclease Z
MTPRFHPHLVNGPFGDPAVYVDFLHERRALLFDLGQIGALPPRKILRISHVFVSHTHIDHFIGFDHLVRICLGREKRVNLFGPPGFVEQVGHRLAAYTWNLVENYETDFTVVATEIAPDCSALTAEFHCLRRFVRENVRSHRSSDGAILSEPTFRVRGCFLDHRTPSLAFALEENRHVNIMKNKVDELGVPTGPWLTELKQAVWRGDGPDTPFLIRWRLGSTECEQATTVGELLERVIRIVPGQKIAYVTDAVFSEANSELSLIHI